MSVEPKDFFCMDDFAPDMRLATRTELYRMQAYHRITTNSVYGTTEAHVDFGVDLRERIGGTDFDIESAVDDAISKDTWVLGVETVVTRTQVGNERTDARVDIRIDTDAGPVELFVAVSELTIELLNEAA